MLGLSAYRLVIRRTPTAAFYEFFEPETGRLVGAASIDVPADNTSRLVRWQRALFDSPTHHWLGVALALAMIPFGVLGAILELLSSPPRRERPRLVVKRADGDEAVLAVRQASGMFYDSRVVYDADGRALAMLRGHSKTPLGRTSFGMIDLRGENEQAREYGDLPWLGQVAPAGDGLFRVALVGLPDAGRIVGHRADGPSVAHYDIEPGPALCANPAGMRLLLAAALALAWHALPA